MTRIVSVLLIVLFIIAAWARLSYMVFIISLAISNLHEFHDILRLLTDEFFDAGFSSDVVPESVDCPVDRNIFGSI
jgi:hypothetical protein